MLGGRAELRPRGVGLAGTEIEIKNEPGARRCRYVERALRRDRRPRFTIPQIGEIMALMPCRYRVVVEGELGPRFHTAFHPMRVEADNGTTAIVGTIRDQAELQGLLDAVFARGLSLISVAPMAID